MWQIVAFIIKKVHINDNPVKHADGCHGVVLESMLVDYNVKHADLGTPKID